MGQESLTDAQKQQLAEWQKRAADQQARVDNSADKGAGWGIQGGSVEKTQKADETQYPSNH